MTVMAARPDWSDPWEPAWHRLLRRLAVSSRLWARRRSRRRFVKQVLAETCDPKVLAELGIALARPRYIERWLMAMHCYQR